MTTFRLAERFGSFLADGEIANKFRFCEIETALSLGHDIVFDLSNVTNMTDSFANACFCNLAADHPTEIASRVKFHGCSPLLRDIISDAISRGMIESSRVAR